MAAPGEWFPQAFAGQVLALKQKSEEFDAQLAHSREQEAARNFQFKQQFALQQQQFAGQEKEQSLRHEEFMVGVTERAKIEADRIKRTNEAMVAHGFDSLAREGTGFIPIDAADKIGPALDAMSKTGASGTDMRFHQIPIPGHGVLIQRIDDTKRQLELAKITQEIQEHKEKSALSNAQANLANEKAETAKQSRLNAVGGIAVREAEAANSAYKGYQAQSGRVMATYIGLGTEDAKKQAALISQDWRNAFPKDSKEANIITQLEAIQDAWSTQVASGRVAQKTNSEQLNSAGLGDALLHITQSLLFGPEASTKPAAGPTGPALSQEANPFFAPGEMIKGSISGSATQGGRHKAPSVLLESGQTVQLQGGATAISGTRLDPLDDPRRRDDATDILKSVKLGKLSPTDPRVQQATAYLRAVADRIKSLQPAPSTGSHFEAPF